jgi:hypothetical protein
MSCQYHRPRTRTQGNQAHEPVWVLWKKINRLPLPAKEPGFFRRPSCSPLTTTTELSYLRVWQPMTGNETMDSIQKGISSPAELLSSPREDSGPLTGPIPLPDHNTVIFQSLSQTWRLLPSLTKNPLFSSGAIWSGWWGARIWAHHKRRRQWLQSILGTRWNHRDLLYFYALSTPSEQNQCTDGKAVTALTFHLWNHSNEVDDIL